VRGPERDVTRLRVAAVDEEHGVTPRELFFDLVLVFGLTQVATLLAHEPTFAGIARSVLVSPRSGGPGRRMPR
jgi:low temperature requirement protein LtrA